MRVWWTKNLDTLHLNGRGGLKLDLWFYRPKNITLSVMQSTTAIGPLCRIVMLIQGIVSCSSPGKHSDHIGCWVSLLSDSPCLESRWDGCTEDVPKPSLASKLGVYGVAALPADAHPVHSARRRHQDVSRSGWFVYRARCVAAAGNADRPALTYVCMDTHITHLHSVASNICNMSLPSKPICTSLSFYIHF